MYKPVNMKTVIFDLDGTLALIDQRRLLSTKSDGKIDWDVFFDPKNIDLDQPNTAVIQMAKVLKDSGHTIAILSGRSVGTLNATIAWLKAHDVPFDIIKMRPLDKMFMPDDKLKQGWLDQHFPDKSDILCVFDDRQKVVDMWRNNGISCFQVAPGNF